MHKLIITNIDWDVDIESYENKRDVILNLNLPLDIEIMVEEDYDMDEVIDNLSDDYGYCICSYEVEER